MRSSVPELEFHKFVFIVYQSSASFLHVFTSITMSQKRKLSPNATDGKKPKTIVVKTLKEEEEDFNRMLLASAEEDIKFAKKMRSIFPNGDQNGEDLSSMSSSDSDDDDPFNYFSKLAMNDCFSATTQSDDCEDESDDDFLDVLNHNNDDDDFWGVSSDDSNDDDFLDAWSYDNDDDDFYGASSNDGDYI